MEVLTFWRGRNIEDLSREELIEALRESVQATGQALDGWRRDQDMRDFFRRIGASS